MIYSNNNNNQSSMIVQQQRLDRNGLDNSIRSTVTVDGLDDLQKMDQQQEPENIKRQKTARMVRFDETKNKYFDSCQRHWEQQQVEDHDTTTSTCPSTCWYTPRDYQRFKRASKEVVSIYMCHLKHQRSEPEYWFARTLGALHQACRATEYEEEDALEVLSPVLREQLERLYEPAADQDAIHNNPALDWIGLEAHFTAGAYGQAVTQRKRQLQQAVADVQDEYRQGFWQGSMNEVSEYDEERRDSCRHISQPAVLLAQLRARALWRVQV